MRSENGTFGKLVITASLLAFVSLGLVGCGQLRRDITGSDRFVQPPKSFFKDRRLPRDNPGAMAINQKFLPKERKQINRNQSPLPEPGPNAAPPLEGTPFAPPPGAAYPQMGGMTPYPGDPNMMGMQGMGMQAPNDPRMMDPFMMGMGGGMPSASPYPQDSYPGQSAYPGTTPRSRMAPSYGTMGAYPGATPQAMMPDPGMIPPPMHARTNLPDAQPYAGGMFTQGFRNRESEYTPPNANYTQPFIPGERNLTAPGAMEPSATPGIGVQPSRPPRVKRPPTPYVPEEETTPIPLTPKDVSSDDPNAPDKPLPWLEPKYTSAAPTPQGNTGTAPQQGESSVSSEQILEWYRASDPSSDGMAHSTTNRTQKEVPNDSLPWLNNGSAPTAPAQGNGSFQGTFNELEPHSGEKLMELAAIDPTKEFTIPSSEEDFLRGQKGGFRASDASTERHIQELKQEIKDLETPKAEMFAPQPGKPASSPKPEIGAISFYKALA
ncbi:MAG: hypothetical protein K0R63_1740 [Rickettsiales bacterium]|jgi:hypothetical protein|nr:hypothetical protein [Rickettsiales bacterium]